MVPLRSSPVTSSSLPSRQLLNDPLHSRMPLLGWWHPTFLPPEARIALPRSRASALTSDSSASHSAEAPQATAQPAGGTFHLYHAAIRLAVRQPGYRHSHGFQISKGHFVSSPGVSETKPHFLKEVGSCSEHTHAERDVA